jgi:ATP-dependent RNA helicase DeaD
VRDSRDREPARSGATGLLYINLGRKAGIRPQDLVGAVANECDLSGREIGPIRIAEHFSTVGIPEESVEHAIRAMRSSVIKGKKATVRRFVAHDDH